jgi:hypothetical protein
MKVAYPIPNTVSIWIGTFATESIFDEVIESAVVPALRLPTDLASVCEVAVQPGTVSIDTLLEGFSGWESFSAAAASAAASRGISTANSALVCYYVACTDAPETWHTLHFLGSFPGSDNS